MQYLNRIISSKISQKPCVVSIGTFDGVHCGHKHLLNAAKELARAKNAELVVFSFTDTPRQKISSSLHKRILLERAGVNILLEVPLVSVSQIHAVGFLEILETMFDIAGWAVGEDVSFGHKRSGDKDLLYQHAKTHGQSTVFVQKIAISHEIISSTFIRNCIQRGDVAYASTLLGRPYSLVIQNPQPAVRLHISDGEMCLPPPGIWEASISPLGSQEVYPAVGRIQTFGMDLFSQQSVLQSEEPIEVFVLRRLAASVDML
jgi:riboflavin kinase/FMN adenylyltransferase